MGQADHFLRRRYRPEDIRNVRKRYDFCPACQKAPELVGTDLPAVVDGGELQLCACFPAKEVPGDNIGVMLHLRQQNLVALADIRKDAGRRDKIDALRRAPDKNNGLGTRRVDKSGDFARAS